MQKVFITGGLGRDAELKTTQAGEDVLSFPVGVSQGYGDKKTTNWFRCSIWGKRARSLKDYLIKGGKVAVSGTLTIGEYEGKAQFNVTVDEVDLMSRSEASERKPTDHDRAKQNAYQPDYLDDDTPF